MAAIAGILIGSLALKLALGALLPISADESYYWVWSQNLQLSYYDHPAAVAIVYWLGLPLDGFGSAVRWPGIILNHLTAVLWYLTLRPYLSSKQLSQYLLLILCAPLIGWGAIIITPDTPFLFFVALTAYLLDIWRRNPSFCLSAAIGVSLGLGFCSKYLIVFAMMIAAFELLRSSISSKQKLAHLGLAGAMFLVAASPVIVWNWQNDFVSFRFQLDHGLAGSNFKLFWVYSYLGGQALILFPFVLWLASRARRDDLNWLHLWVWPILGFFLFSSFRAHVEANWPIMVTAPLLALALVGASKWKNWPYYLAGFWSFLFALLIIQFFLSPLPINSQNSKLGELTRHEELVEVAKSHRPFYARTYQMAAKLSHELKYPIYKLRGMNRIDHYDFLPESLPLAKRYFVVLGYREPLPPWALEAGHRVLNETPLPNGLRLAEVSAP